MRRFFQPAASVREGLITLTGAEAHHAAQVIRLRVGESAVVLDGKGAEHQCTAVRIDRRQVDLKIERTQHHPAPGCRIRLVQAITKGKSFDLILQKAVELGATEIQPLLSERVVARPHPREFQDKAEKWNLVLIEAAKQCGAVWLPVVREPLEIANALAAETEFELRLVAALNLDPIHPHRVFSEFIEKERRSPRSVSIWVGPEGDFTADELALICRAGAMPVTLGSLVLRSETAAVSALAIVNHELSLPRD